VRGALSVSIAALGAPVLCGGFFVATFVVTVGLIVQQLPGWAQEGLLGWMLGTPQPVFSDYHGEPGEGSEGVFSGGQVEFAGYAGPASFACRIPSEKGAKTDDYGVPRDPYPAHSGIDFGTCRKYDVPVITPMGGMVVFAGWSSVGYGNLLVIENDGWQVYLAHNNSFLIGIGDLVSAGDAVALSGSTGNSTGPHVHFETRECLEGGDGHIACVPRNPDLVLLPGQVEFCAWSRLPGTCGD
jgi:murein DD-endopeptidase MepM/ murein hydrolase activator NlpD